jgi:hypothetical protein
MLAPNSTSDQQIMEECAPSAVFVPDDFSAGGILVDIIKESKDEYEPRRIRLMWGKKFFDISTEKLSTFMLSLINSPEQTRSADRWPLGMLLWAFTFLALSRARKHPLLRDNQWSLAPRVPYAPPSPSSASSASSASSNKGAVYPMSLYLVFLFSTSAVTDTSDLGPDGLEFRRFLSSAFIQSRSQYLNRYFLEQHWQAILQEFLNHHQPTFSLLEAALSFGHRVSQEYERAELVLGRNECRSENRSTRMVNVNVSLQSLKDFQSTVERSHTRFISFDGLENSVVVLLHSNQYTLHPERIFNHILQSVCEWILGSHDEFRNKCKVIDFSTQSVSQLAVVLPSTWKTLWIHQRSGNQKGLTNRHTRCSMVAYSSRGQIMESFAASCSRRRDCHLRKRPHPFH